MKKLRPIEVNQYCFGFFSQALKIDFLFRAILGLREIEQKNTDSLQIPTPPNLAPTFPHSFPLLLTSCIKSGTLVTTDGPILTYY